MRKSIEESVRINWNKMRDQIKVVQEKLDLRFGENPGYKTVTKRLQQVTTKAISNFDRAKQKLSQGKKEIKKLRKRYQKNPNKLLEDTLTQAKKVAKSPWKESKTSPLTRAKEETSRPEKHVSTS